MKKLIRGLVTLKNSRLNEGQKKGFISDFEAKTRHHSQLQHRAKDLTTLSPCSEQSHHRYVQAYDLFCVTDLVTILSPCSMPDQQRLRLIKPAYMRPTVNKIASLRKFVEQGDAKYGRKAVKNLSELWN